MTGSPGFFSTGSASPVRSDSSISSPSASPTIPSTTTLSPGPSSMTSSRTISEVEISPVAPSRRTLGLASPMTARPSRVFLARSSWMMPMPVFAMITKPNRLSWIGATISMITQSTPMMALKRVKTFARTISEVDREDRTGTSLTSPRATRSATSAVPSPPGLKRGAGGLIGWTGSSSAPASMAVPTGARPAVPPPAPPPPVGRGPSDSVSARCVMLSTVKGLRTLHPPSRTKIRLRDDPNPPPGLPSPSARGPKEDWTPGPYCAPAAPDPSAAAACCSLWRLIAASRPRAYQMPNRPRAAPASGVQTHHNMPRSANHP